MRENSLHTGKLTIELMKKLVNDCEGNWGTFAITPEDSTGLGEARQQRNGAWRPHAARLFLGDGYTEISLKNCVIAVDVPSMGAINRVY